MAKLLIEQIRRNIVRPALKSIDPVIPYSITAENLIMGTGMAESRYKEFVQRNNGPARGWWQMEPATHNDIYWNYLAFKPGVASLVDGGPGDADRMVYDLRYAVLMCRIHYFRVKQPLPANEPRALGEYYKRFYNTLEGKATVGKFVEAYKRVDIS